MPANLENSALATGLEKVSFYPALQEILYRLSYQGGPGGLCFCTCMIQGKFPEVFVQRRDSLAGLLASLIQEQCGRDLGFLGLFFFPCSPDPEF